MRIRESVARVSMTALTAVAAIALAAAPALLSAQRATPSAQRAVPRADTAVPFKVGESLTFDVSLATFMVAGTAVTSVRERRATDGNAAAYYIVAEGRPLPLLSRLYALYYKMDTLLDTATLLPRRMTLYSEEGSRQRLGTTRFDRATRKAFFERSGDPTVKADVSVPAQVQDGLSLLYAVRASAITPGTKLSYPIIDEGSIYTVSMLASATERVRVPFGEVSAWRLGVQITDARGEMVGSNVGLWISDDARRLPVKMQADLPAGSFALALRDVR
jgi:methionine-rich copper-binding protein CopC